MMFVTLNEMRIFWILNWVQHFACNPNSFIVVPSYTYNGKCFLFKKPVSVKKWAFLYFRHPEFILQVEIIF